MKVVKEEAFNALLCESCGGMFYPEGEFVKHLELVRRRKPGQLKTSTPTDASTDGALEGVCPGCAAGMQRKPFGYESNIVLTCVQCGGLWMQPGQIEQVALFLKRTKSVDELPDEMLDRYAKALLDEEEQRETFARVKDIGTTEPSFLAPFFQFMPVSDADGLGRRPVAVYGLILLNVVLFIFARSYFGVMAMVPAEVTKGYRLYTLVTHQFAHAGIFHLFVNMVFLRAFGDRPEDQLTWSGLLGLYVVLGVVAGLAQAFMDPNSTVPCIGASGSISGIMGFYCVVFPTRMLRVTVWFRTVRVPAIVYLVLWFAIQAVLGPRPGIAVAAHLGGFLAGAWAGGIARILYVGAAGRATSTQRKR